MVLVSGAVAEPGAEDAAAPFQPQLSFNSYNRGAPAADRGLVQPVEATSSPASAEPKPEKK